MKLKYDEPLSNFAFKFNLRRYNLAEYVGNYVTSVPETVEVYLGGVKVGRCSLTLSNPS